MADQITNPVWTCAQCSAAFTGRKRKFCSDDCRKTAQHRKRYPRAWGDYAADAAAKALRRTCPHCGEEFRPSRHDGHIKGPQTYCSVACKMARAEQDRRAKQEQAYKNWLLTEVRWGPVSRVKRCACGKFLNPINWVRQCLSCQRANADKSKRKWRSATEIRRRARLRTARVEQFDPFEIFDRDGWSCYICGIKTPKHLRGTHEPNAPELDHIVPLAAGGEHSMRNTACSCRKCNGEKGARPLGQMRLVA